MELTGILDDTVVFRQRKEKWDSNSTSDYKEVGLPNQSCVFKNHLPNTQQFILSQPSLRLSQHEVRNLRSLWRFSSFQLRYSRRSAPRLWLRPDALSTPTTMSCELDPSCYIASLETSYTPSLGPSPAVPPTCLPRTLDHDSFHY